MLILVLNVTDSRPDLGCNPCWQGYGNVGLDDNWQACGAGVRGSFHDWEGRPIVNLDRFPDLKAMTTYGHERGVRMNFYANNCMCVENGDNGLYEDDEIYDHYVGDVQMLVENGFDGVKVDACGQYRDMALFARLLNESGRQVMLENCHWGMCWDTEDGRGISGWGWGVAGEHDWREGNSGCPERLPDGNVTCPCKRAAVRTHALSIIAGAGRGLAFRISCSQFTSFERVETSTRASSTGCATSRAQSDFSIGMRRWPGEDVGPTQTW